MNFKRFWGLWHGGEDGGTGRVIIPAGWLGRKARIPLASFWDVAGACSPSVCFTNFVLPAPFRDVNGTSVDINHQLTVEIVRVLWDLRLSLVLEKLL